MKTGTWTLLPLVGCMAIGCNTGLASSGGGSGSGGSRTGSGGSIGSGGAGGSEVVTGSGGTGGNPDAGSAGSGGTPLGGADAGPDSPAGGIDIPSLLRPYNVTWDVPGPTSSASMPLGNGDIGLNVWVQPNGDLGLYVSKSDAWSEMPWGQKGAMKIGGMHLSISPNPLKPGVPFAQTLDLHKGEIQISEGTGADAVAIRIWVDANHPVVRIEVQSVRPSSVKVILDNWRTALQEEGNISADTVLSDQANRIAWYHRNGPKGEKQVLNVTFGAVIKGAGLATKDAQTLQSPSSATSQLVSIYPLTATTQTAQEWLQQLNRQIDQVDALNLEQSRGEHAKWWDGFWRRSWISVSGDQEAADITRGYVLQRFITACAGRGAYPIHFNGSIFTVDNPTFNRGAALPPGVDADYRDWGAHYWMQNTRAIYWPLLATGDYDVMQPFLKMYREMLPANTASVKEFYNHDGAYFAEEILPWRTLSKVNPEDPAGYTKHYYTPILELSMMMLDYYEYTGDENFARNTLLPTALAGLSFFQQHFGRDGQGKILVEPANAIEMYFKVKNPAPDVAGLQAIIPRVLELPAGLVDSTQRAWLTKMQAELPGLALGTKDNKQVILPYAGDQISPRHNDENPELYSVYPFRLYGVGRPNLQLALDSFALRTVRDHRGNWVQDPVQAALLGLTGEAKAGAFYNSHFVEPGVKFPAFWSKANSYVPGQENGGNLQNTLQKMLLQAVGRKILLMPAWPKEWSADFKLHAPFQTIVEGRIERGKVIELKVTPPERRADILEAAN